MRDLINLVEASFGKRRRDHVAKRYADQRPEEDRRFWRSVSEERMIELVAKDPLDYYPLVVKAGRDSEAIRTAPIRSIEAHFTGGQRGGHIWYKIVRYGFTDLYDGEVVIEAPFAWRTGIFRSIANGDLGPELRDVAPLWAEGAWQAFEREYASHPNAYFIAPWLPEVAEVAGKEAKLTTIKQKLVGERYHKLNEASHEVQDRAAMERFKKATLLVLSQMNFEEPNYF